VLEIAPDERLSSTTLTPPARFPVLKWLAVVLAILIGLLGAVVLVGPLVLPQSAARDLVGGAGKLFLGEQVSVQGPVDLALVPTLTLEAEDILIGEAPEAAGAVTIQRLSLSLDTLALITGALDFERLRIERPVLRRADAAMAAQEVTRSAWGLWRDLAIGDFVLSDGRIEQSADDNADATVLVDGISVVKAPSPPDGTVAVRLDAKARWRGIDWVARTDFGSATGLITGAGTKTKLNIVGAGLKASFDGRAAWRHGLVAAGAVSALGEDLGVVSRLTGVPAAALGDGLLRFDGKLTLDAGRSALEGVSLEFGRTTAGGQVAVTRRGAGGELSGTIIAETLDLVAVWPLLARLTGETSDLGRLAGHFPALGEIQVRWDELLAGDISGDAGGLRIARAKPNAPLIVAVDRMGLAGGNLRGELTLGHAEGMTALKAVLKMRAVDLTQLSTALDADWPVSGEGSVELDLLSVGADNHQLLAALRGQGTLVVTSGEWRKTELLETILEDLEAEEPLTFTQLAGSFRVSRGILVNDDLLLQAKGWSMIGAGKLDLANDQLKWRLTTLVEKSGGERRTVDYDVTGSMAAPEIVPAP